MSAVPGAVHGVVIDVLAPLTFHNVETKKKIVDVLFPKGAP